MCLSPCELVSGPGHSVRQLTLLVGPLPLLNSLWPKQSRMVSAVWLLVMLVPGQKPKMSSKSYKQGGILGLEMSASLLGIL